MIGGVVVTIQTMGLATAALPFVTGAIALFVAYGRWRVAPLDTPDTTARFLVRGLNSRLVSQRPGLSKQTNVVVYMPDTCTRVTTVDREQIERFSQAARPARRWCLRAADVTEPIAALVLRQLTNEFGAMGAEAGKDVLDILDSEH